MTKKDLSQALKLARSNIDLKVDTSFFDGYGLRDFKPVHCTICQVAQLMRWQVLNITGTVDAEALNELATVGRKKFVIIG